MTINKKYDLVGKKFNKLIVISYAYKKRYYYWNCICDCGKHVIVKGNHLRTNQTKSCGCLKNLLTDKKMENMRKAAKISGDKTRYTNEKLFYSMVINSYKTNAKKRNITYELDYNYAKKLLTSNCFYCGQINLKKRTTTYRTILLYPLTGIDRIDPIKGYSINNTTSCCSICNRAKSNLKLNEFIEWINNIKRNNNEN